MHTYLGIDVGKTAIHVAFPPVYNKNFNPYHKLDHKQWKTTYVVNMKDAIWWRHLIDLVAEDQPAFVALESTGYHLSAPVIAVIRRYRPDARVWVVDGKRTAATRSDLVSDAKNDRLDSIALCLIAMRCAIGEAPRGAREFDYENSVASDKLRRMVNNHHRLTKEKTRAKNRLNIHAYSMFPSFAGSAAWLRAARNGAVTPAEVIVLAENVRQFPSGDYIDGRIRNPLLRLADNLPDVDADREVRSICNELIVTLDAIVDETKSSKLRILDATLEEPFSLVSRRWYATMPGISPVLVAALHVATYGQAIKFNRNEFCAAVGTSPKTSASGDDDKTQMNRKGYRPVRGLLHMYAVFLISPNAAPNRIRAVHQQLKFPSTRNKLARMLWGIARDETINPSVDEIYELLGGGTSDAQEAGE